MLQLGFIGCGGISRAHLDGLAELQQEGRERFVLGAVCDPDRARAEALAERAHAALGHRPEVFTEYGALLQSPGLNAVSIMVPHHLHHDIARDAFAAGVDVQMQKPIAISPRFAHQIMQDAATYGRVLTIAEPSVLGAGPRALARAVQDGLIGRPYLAIDFATAVTRGGFFANTPWRHMKGYAGGGWINDHGVHRTHLLIDVLGPIQQVFAYTELFEPVRRAAEVELTTTGEDAAVVVLRFGSGALGHWMCATAAHGERASGVWLYGSRGVIRPGQYFQADNESRIDWAELIQRYAPDVPSGAFAHSYVELADAIEHGRVPVASAERATDALGVVFAALEAATLGRPVDVADVLAGRAHAYEDTVITEMETIVALS